MTVSPSPWPYIMLRNVHRFAGFLELTVAIIREEGKAVATGGKDIRALAAELAGQQIDEAAAAPWPAVGRYTVKGRQSAVRSLTCRGLRGGRLAAGPASPAAAGIGPISTRASKAKGSAGWPGASGPSG
jgi:hypothetical protein